MKSVKTKLPGS
jgi:hypothetical protein